MGQKYRTIRISDGAVIPHIEGKLCGCGRVLPLSHQGSCPDCGGTKFKEMAAPNLNDLDTAERTLKPERYPPMGGTD